MPTLVIPANQHIKKGEKFLIILNGINIWLEATDDTWSASYDTKTWCNDFQPHVHGFAGMNMPISMLILSFSYNAYCAQYILKDGTIECPRSRFITGPATDELIV